MEGGKKEKKEKKLELTQHPTCQSQLYSVEAGGAAPVAYTILSRQALCNRAMPHHPLFQVMVGVHRMVEQDQNQQSVRSLYCLLRGLRLKPIIRIGSPF